MTELEKTHDQRIASDPDFQLLLQDLDSFEKVRTQKIVSLNLQTRIAEREQLEKERLARENQRRAHRGQPAIANLTELTGTEQPDAVLAETTQIAADLAGINSQYLTRLKAEAAKPGATTANP